MPGTGFTFEGLDEITQRIHRAAERVAYVVVQDRSERGRDVTLGRFDLGDGWRPADARGAQGDGACPGGIEPTPDERVEAAVAWVRELAAANTVGGGCARFRLKAWGPKGQRLVTSGHFTCRFGAVEGELQAVVAEMRASGAPLDRMVVAVLDERVRRRRGTKEGEDGPGTGEPSVQG